MLEFVYLSNSTKLCKLFKNKCLKFISKWGKLFFSDKLTLRFCLMVLHGCKSDYCHPNCCTSKAV
jgi:hypothetical protein